MNRESRNANPHLPKYPLGLPYHGQQGYMRTYFGLATLRLAVE